MGLDGTTITFILIGLASGLTSGIFGVGGGVVIVPALIYYAGFSQHKAIGTSLAVLLPPIGIAAVTEYYREGNVDFRAAAYIAILMLAGAWVGAKVAHRLPATQLKLAFGVFMIVLGVYYVYSVLARSVPAVDV